MKKVYIEAIEKTNKSTREIESISLDGENFYILDDSYPIGLSQLDKNYLTFACRKGKKEFKIYVESEGSKCKYFIIK